MCDISVISFTKLLITYPKLHKAHMVCPMKYEFVMFCFAVQKVSLLMVVCDLFINIIQCCLLYTQSSPIPAQLKVTKYCVPHKRQRENINQFELTHRHPILCPCGPSNRIPFSGCVIYLFILFRVVLLVLKLFYVCTSANVGALQNMDKNSCYVNTTQQSTNLC